VQKYIEKEISRSVEMKLSEQEIMDTVDEGLELEGRVALERGRGISAHHDAVLEADVIVPVPETVIHAKTEEQEAQHKKDGENEKMLDVLQCPLQRDMILFLAAL
jgi:arginine decarboxylase-like protein